MFVGQEFRPRKKYLWTTRADGGHDWLRCLHGCCTLVVLPAAALDASLLLSELLGLPPLGVLLAEAGLLPAGALSIGVVGLVLLPEPRILVALRQTAVGIVTPESVRVDAQIVDIFGGISGLIYRAHIQIIII